jgi:class 3 adenylate cyclase
MNMDLDELELAAYLGISKDGLSHIPEYARHAALQAINKVRDLEKANLFRPGLYYVALIDLVGSTKASLHLGHDLNTRRIETFVAATVEALGQISPRNYVQCVKEIGDASLFIFSSFSDLYSWWQKAEENFETYNQEIEHEGELDDYQLPIFRLSAKTVVHLGEVSFSEGKNPVAFAVNQVFKIEKLFSAGQLGATDAVKEAAAPNLVDLKLIPTRHTDVLLPEMQKKTPTWILAHV